MTPELWGRLKPLYTAALDLPEEGRTSFIEEVCGSDGELARELRALIEANSSAAHTLDPPLAGFSLFQSFRNPVLEPGTVLAGRFRIVRHLGSGGMGDVYDAVDVQLGQGRIALKTLRPEIAGNPQALIRFKEEVLLARKITGPNTCRIHELYLTGSEGGGTPVAFLTMELLDGITLHDHIEQHSPLAVAEIRNLAAQLCAALGCIHEAGIIHRDLKTRNVMLVPHAGGQKVVVMDFGLALASTPEAMAAEHRGDSALVAGTPSYMAPEQFEGREAGPPTDIYAFGLILYEMATGVQPFAAHTPLAAAIRRSQRPRFVSSFRHELPPAWDDIIQRCMEYDPDRRFQSAGEVGEALEHPGKIVLRLGKDHRVAFSRAALSILALAAIVILCGITWFWVREAQRRKLSPEAAHWYSLGTTALREGSYLKATRLLTEVTRRDPTYAVAHAALADAWSELDYTDQAQHEMLLASAPDEQRGLGDLDRRYIDAVRTTIIRDYSAAAQDYEAILSRDPDDRKADGFVDLGRIYEKAGKVAETIGAYEQAAKLNPDDPAPFLHLGILRSRLRDPAAASTAFQRAASLYRAESDPEGEAEVTYQRAYAAVEAGDYSRAQPLATEALNIARQIPSAALEVRSLSQLSSVAYHQDQDSAALDYARQELDVARKSRLSYWTTDSEIRRANALMDTENFSAAEDALGAALRQAEQDGHPRLKANAELTLASLCNQQRRLDEQIRLAESALQYYKDYGFLNAADNAETLVLRGERDKGDYQGALQAGNQLLQIAAQTQSVSSLTVAQELVGIVLLDLERYPDAVSLLQQSVANAQSQGQDGAYQKIGLAEAFWRLGQYGEAASLLASIPAARSKRADLGSAILTVRAEMLLSQDKFGEAIGTIHQARSLYPGNTLDKAVWDRVELAAKGQLKPGSEDLRNAEGIVSAAQTHGDPIEAARAEFTLASLALAAGDALAAETAAAQAERPASARGLRESQALALLVQAEAAAALQQTQRASDLSKKSVDLFRELQQSWGVQTFATYLKRPDRQRTMRALARVCGESGDIPHELSS